jgi:hypothetical protein
MSGMDLIVYGVFVAPMAGLLIANYFKVDQIVARPQRRTAPRGLISPAAGSRPASIDPGGSGHAGRRRMNRKIAADRERRRNRASANRFG